MELRHLRYFVAVAQELHFAHAAQRLNIEQSPLSRAIKDLEADLGTPLFIRTSRKTRLTHAGERLLQNVPRVFAALQQARDSVHAAALGFRKELRIALSDDIPCARLATILAHSHRNDPATDLRLFPVPLAQQLQGLHDDLYDLGFAQSAEVGTGIVAQPLWNDPIMVALPAKHPLLQHPQLTLEQLEGYPLVLYDTALCEGHARQVDHLLRNARIEPQIIQRMASWDLLLVMVCACQVLGLTSASHITAHRELGIEGRPLAGPTPLITTYLLRPAVEPSAALLRFLELLRSPSTCPLAATQAQ